MEVAEHAGWGSVAAIATASSGFRVQASVLDREIESS
jgi:hypothetical protein